MSDKIELTIGIPSYNAGKKLIKTIQSILLEIESSGHKLDGIEVLVSDNDSKDESASSIKKYISKYPKVVSYYKNRENYGYDENIDLIVQRAKGKYIWFLGAGEVVAKGGLERIMKEIKNERYDNVIVNFAIYNEDKNRIETQKNYAISNRVVFRHKEEFFERTQFGITAMSSNVVLKEQWENIIKNKLLVSGWCHVERIIDILSSREYQKSLFIESVCFTLLREKDGWWTKGGLFYLNSISLRKIAINMQKKGYKNETVVYLMKKINHNVAKMVYEAKIRGYTANIKEIIESIQVWRWEMSFWFIALPLLLMPTSICNIGRRIYKYIRKMARIL